MYNICRSLVGKSTATYGKGLATWLLSFLPLKGTLTHQGPSDSESPCKHPRGVIFLLLYLSRDTQVLETALRRSRNDDWCKVSAPTSCTASSSAHPPRILRASPCIILPASSLHPLRILPASSTHPPCILRASSCILPSSSLHLLLPGQPAERQAVGSEAEDEVLASSLLTDRLTTAFNRPQATDFTWSLESGNNNIF